MNPKSLSENALMCITRDDPSLSHFHQVEAFVSSGARLIQLRSKALSSKNLFEQAKRAVEHTKRHNCHLIINDYYQLAKDIDADGVHLGVKDAPVGLVRNLLPPSKIIGKTVHSVSEARKFIDEKPDYFGLGPYRKSSTKNDLKPVLSEADFQNIIATLKSFPVFLIGGLTINDFPLIEHFNLQGIAMCSELFCGTTVSSKIRSVIENSRKFEKSVHYA